VGRGAHVQGLVNATTISLPEGPPSAEGNLEKTPFSHLLVYALDRQLTGELVLESKDLVQVIRVEAGVPTKIRVSDTFFRLGDRLVEEGLCPRDSVEGAALTGGLLGDLLVLTGCVEAERLEAVLEQQFLARMTRCFELEPTATYKYFDKGGSLAEWGGEPAAVDPIELVWTGLSAHAERSTSFEVTLGRIGARRLTLHPRAPTSRLKLSDELEGVIAQLADGVEFGALVEQAGEAAPLVQRLIYALVILRQLDLGTGAAPVGVRDARPASLAKVQLRSETHRVGAAVDSKSSAATTRITVGGRKIIPRDDDAAASVPPPALDEAAMLEGERETPSLSFDTSSFDTSDVGAISMSEEEIDPALLEEEEDPREGLQAAAEPDPEEADETSSRRMVPEALRALDAAALKSLATEKLHEREPALAVQACEVALSKLEGTPEQAEPLFHQLKALLVRAKIQEPQPNLKALAIELDELIRERDDVPETRASRGQLRRRLGDSLGATSDYRRVLEMSGAPSALVDEAKKELLELEPKTAGRGQTGFLKRLFKR
jgi:hypothetical protein